MFAPPCLAMFSLLAICSAPGGLPASPMELHTVTQGTSPSLPIFAASICSSSQPRPRRPQQQQKKTHKQTKNIDHDDGDDDHDDDDSNGNSTKDNTVNKNKNTSAEHQQSEGTWQPFTTAKHVRCGRARHRSNTVLHKGKQTQQASVKIKTWTAKTYKMSAWQRPKARKPRCVRCPPCPSLQETMAWHKV